MQVEPRVVLPTPRPRNGPFVRRVVMTDSQSHQLTLEQQRRLEPVLQQFEGALSECPNGKLPDVQTFLGDHQGPERIFLHQEMQAILEERVRGDYVLLEQLGEGGMGVVYRARLIRFAGPKVLKEIHPEALGVRDREGLQRWLQREIQAAELLGSHPNLVQYSDGGLREDGTPFLIMEWIDGKDFRQILQDNGPLSISDACQVARDAALGLAHAHSRGVIHRDIKPNNLMLSRFGIVKILDFGLSRVTEAANLDAQLSVGKVLGTLDYLPPDRLLSHRVQPSSQALTPRRPTGSSGRSSGGSPIDVEEHERGVRGDVYSLGCTLYCLLAGHPPFAHAEDPLSKIEAHAQEQPQPPPGVEVGSKLWTVLSRMLAKHSCQRQPSMDAIAEALAPLCRNSNLRALIDSDADSSLPSLKHFQQRTPRSLSSTISNLAPEGELETPFEASTEGYQPETLSSEENDRPSPNGATQPGQTEPATSEPHHLQPAGPQPILLQTHPSKPEHSLARWLGTLPKLSLTQTSLAAVCTAVVGVVVLGLLVWFLLPRPAPHLGPGRWVLNQPGPSGRWWFDEAPWLLPAARLEVAQHLDQTASQRLQTHLDEGRVVQFLNELAEYASGVLPAGSVTQEQFNTLRGYPLFQLSDKEKTSRLQSLTRSEEQLQSATDWHTEALLQHRLKNWQQAEAAYQKARVAYLENNQPRLWVLATSDLAQLAADRGIFSRAQGLYSTAARAISPEKDNADAGQLWFLTKCREADMHRRTEIGWERSQQSLQLASQNLPDLQLGSNHPYLAVWKERAAWAQLDRWNPIQAKALFDEARLRRSRQADEIWHRYFLLYDKQGLAMAEFLDGNWNSARGDLQLLHQQLVDLSEAGADPQERNVARGRIPNVRERWADTFLFDLRASAEDYSAGLTHLKDAIAAAAQNDFQDNPTRAPHLVRLKYKLVVMLAFQPQNGVANKPRAEAVEQAVRSADKLWQQLDHNMLASDDALAIFADTRQLARQICRTPLVVGPEEPLAQDALKELVDDQLTPPTDIRHRRDDVLIRLKVISGLLLQRQWLSPEQIDRLRALGRQTLNQLRPQSNRPAEAEKLPGLFRSYQQLFSTTLLRLRN